MNILDIKEGNCLRMIGQNLDEFVIVSGINIKENKIVICDANGESVSLDMAIAAKYILPIPLSDTILCKLGYIKEDRAVHGLLSADVYSLYFSHFTVEIINDENRGWCLVIPSPNSFWGCKLAPTPNLSDLQNILSPLFIYKIDLKLLKK